MSDGKATGAGVDIRDLPPARAANMVYYWMVEGRDENARAKIENDLHQPIPGMSDTAAGDAARVAREMGMFADLANRNG